MLVLPLCVLLACPAPSSLVLGAPAFVQERRAEPQTPSEQAVDQAIERLRQAFVIKDSAKQIEALNGVARVPHPDVVKAAEPGMTSKYPEVRRATIELLGAMRDPAALKRLLRHAKKSKRDLAKDADMHVLVTKAIGRHGSPLALKFLGDGMLNARTPNVIQARILSIGQIRDRDAVAILLKQMKASDYRKVQNLMPHFQLALMRLTGHDAGSNPTLWQTWWRSLPKDWQVAPEPGLLPKSFQLRWDGYWGNRRKLQRNRQRQDRGQDPAENSPPDRKRRGEDDGR